MSFFELLSAWLMYSMCLSRSISHMCRQIPTSYSMEHASIFDDTLRREIREILLTRISDLELPLDLGGAGIFDINNTAKACLVASYQECFKHTAIHFPVVNDLIHSNVLDDRRMICTMRCFNEERAQLICLANELNLPTPSPDVEREAIKLQYSFNQIPIKLQYEEFRKSVQGRRDYEAKEESFAFLRSIPYKKHLVMNPDRFKTAFKIRLKLPLTFGANFVCKCGFNCRDKTDTHPLRCPCNESNYACHNRALQFVKSLARDAGFHAPKCLRESAPGVTGLRADGIILLADEDCSKDLIPCIKERLLPPMHQPQLCHLPAPRIHRLWIIP
jgi:hypothetical protein